MIWFTKRSRKHDWFEKYWNDYGYRVWLLMFVSAGSVGTLELISSNSFDSVYVKFPKSVIPKLYD